MGETISVCKPLLLTVANQTVYSLYPQRWFTVKNIHVTNTTNVAATVRVCLVPSAGAAGQNNALVWDLSIDANKFIEFGEGLKFPPGSSLVAAAGAANSVNLFLCGTEE